MIFLTDASILALPFHLSHVYTFFFEQKKEQITTLIHACSCVHYTNCEFY